jgi:hypothetical protein
MTYSDYIMIDSSIHPNEVKRSFYNYCLLNRNRNFNDNHRCFFTIAIPQKYPDEIISNTESEYHQYTLDIYRTDKINDILK